MRKVHVLQRLMLLSLFAALCGGCASSGGRRAGAKPAPSANEPTVVGGHEYRDPLMRLNRVFFAFNDVTYRYLLIPAAKGYLWVTPDPAERGVSNFFHNIKTPIYVANDILQLKPRPLGRHLARFLVNSTAGLGGLFDPARAWFGLERKGTGFEDTLARYGAGYGFYLVIPILGTSDARNVVGLTVDYFLNPIPYLLDGPAETAVMSFDGLQDYAPKAEDYETLRRKAKDPYVFFRNLRLQGVERDAGRL